MAGTGMGVEKGGGWEREREIHTYTRNTVCGERGGVHGKRKRERDTHT